MTRPYDDVSTRSFRLELEGEDRILRGRLDIPADAERTGRRCPYVLVLHGFKGFMNWGFFPLLSRRLARAGVVAVSFNMSGSGVGEDLETFTEEEAFAHNTYSQELDDVGVVRSFVEESGMPWIDPGRRGIFGHSMGGGVALLHAAERADYHAVATWAAISTVVRYDEETLAAWRRDGRLVIRNARTGQELPLATDLLDDIEKNREALDIRAACGRLRAPTLLVHGTADEAVPYPEGEALARAFPEGVARLVTVKGGGHTFGAVHPLVETTPHLERVLADTEAHFRAALMNP